MTHRLTSCSLPQVVGWAVFCATWLAGSAWACDTPVYRYAMYRWLPAPYELYCFHSGQLDADAQKIVAAVERYGTHETAPANVVVFPVNVQDEKELAGVFPDVREAWDKQSSKQTPWYLLSSPVGVHVFGGTITEADMAALVDSPARRAVGRLLGQGKAGVYLLLTNDDQAANESAEQEIRGVMDDVAAGKIALYASPARSAGENAPKSPAIEFGLVKVARSDASERWLVDCLLASAPDLRDHAEPQAFLIYGRGRTVFSSLGNGIQRDNLTMDVEFITGACSCMVKEENPGVDLLMSYDWNAAAESLAEQYGAEEGNPYGSGGGALFPELVIPLDEPTTPKAEVTAGTTATSPQTDPPAEGATAATTATTTSAAPAADAVKDARTDAQTGLRSAAAEQLADRALPSASAETVETAIPSSWRAFFWVGGGLIGALVVLFGATFLVLRPR